MDATNKQAFGGRGGGSAAGNKRGMLRGPSLVGAGLVRICDCGGILLAERDPEDPFRKRWPTHCHHCGSEVTVPNGCKLSDDYWPQQRVANRTGHPGQ